MINAPPQQQQHHYNHTTHSLHLMISLILFVLTVYPYLFNPNSICCSVAALSAQELDLKHTRIDKFDIITSEEIIVFRAPSAQDIGKQKDFGSLANEAPHGQEALNAITYQLTDQFVEKLQFSALGNKFDLSLSRPLHWITNDLTIITLDSHGNATKVPYNRDQSRVYEGYLENFANSKATISFDSPNRLSSAHIQTGKDFIIVEPTYLHRGNLWFLNNRSNLKVIDNVPPNFYKNTLIVYNLSDHSAFQSNTSDTPKWSHLGNSLLHDSPVAGCYVSPSSDNASDTNESEMIFDYNVDSFKKYRRRGKRGIEILTEQPRDRTRCTLHLVVDYLFYKHVGKGDLQTTINYLLALINRVNQIYLPTIWEAGDDSTMSNIGFAVQNITIHQEYTRISSGDLHYNMQSDRIWGAREFLDNFSRYSPPRHYCLAHLLTYRQFDTPVLGLAYVASARFGTLGGICSPIQQKGDVLYKHNTGISTSKGINGETLITRQADLVLAHELGHNLGAEHDTDECKPPSSSGGAYLMHPYAVLGFEKNNRFMSHCSRQAIGRVVRRKGPTCFVGAVDNVCGNGIVEGDEECDGGDVGLGHSDPCCDSSCRLTPGSVCSDRHSWCCANCSIVPAFSQCRKAEEYNCKQASVCNGTSPECPAPPPVEDNSICVGRGLCRGGDCIPFCEARGLQSCLCTTQQDACRLCCRPSMNDTCTPYDINLPYLHDGVLCYRGICEKGRCEQPIQDVVERLWDVIEDINLAIVVKFLRDNIILVVILSSIPVWCIFSHFINEFDRRIKEDVITSILKNSRKRKTHPSQSPFLPRLFVGDDNSNSNSAEELHQQTIDKVPVTQGEHDKASNGHSSPIRKPIGFQPPNFGFRLPEGEEVILEPRGSIPMAGIEAGDPETEHSEFRNGGQINDMNNGAETIAPGVYSTRV